MRFVFHPEAEAEAAAQRDYYDNKEEGLGRRFSEWLMMHVGLLTANPQSFPVKWKVRHCYMSIFPFDIVFEEFDDHIVIYAVAHTKRKPGYWRERLNDTVQ